MPRFFGRFLGTILENAKHKKVAPGNFFNLQLKILALIFGSLKFVLPKCTFLGPQFIWRGLVWYLLNSWAPSVSMIILKITEISDMIKKNRKIIITGHIIESDLIAFPLTYMNCLVTIFEWPQIANLWFVIFGWKILHCTLCCARHSLFWLSRTSQPRGIDYQK